MADLWQLSDLGVVSVLLTHQKTLRDALGTMIQYRHLMNEFLVIRIEENGRRVIVREDVVADEAGPTSAVR
ncbi:AraC family transcriptional regulator ligand-binding domain-containing protein [Cupriavidus basilensis]